MRMNSGTTSVSAMRGHRAANTATRATSWGKAATRCASSMRRTRLRPAGSRPHGYKTSTVPGVHDLTAKDNSVIAQALVVPKPDTRGQLLHQPSQTSRLRQRPVQHLPEPSACIAAAPLRACPPTCSPRWAQARRSATRSMATAFLWLASATAPPLRHGHAARVAPGVSLTPISQSAAAGNSISYQITVTNNNNSGCGTSTFAFTRGCQAAGAAAIRRLPCHWTGVSTSSTWTVTFPAPSGRTELRGVLDDIRHGATTSSATAQGNYIVTTPDSVPPTVKIVSLADGATVKASSRFRPKPVTTSASPKSSSGSTAS